MKIKKTCKYCYSKLILDEKELKDLTKKQKEEIEKEIKRINKISEELTKQLNKNKYDCSIILSASMLNYSNLMKLLCLNNKYFKCPICKGENYL